MTNSAQYLEAAKVEEVAAQLKAEGYAVSLHPMASSNDVGYDIIATKGGRRVAVGIKARAHLRESARLIREMRERAVQQGYDEFRLVIVNPPRERRIEIENLEGILYEYMINESFAEIEELSGGTSIEEVSDIEVDAIEVKSNGMNIKGTALVLVSLAYGGGKAHDGVSINYGFPFTFTVELTHDMHIEAGQINIDTANFFE